MTKEEIARKNLATLLVAEHGDNIQQAARDFALLCDALGLDVKGRKLHIPGRCHQCGKALPLHTQSPSSGPKYRTDQGGVCSIKCKTAYYRGEGR